MANLIIWNSQNIPGSYVKISRPAGPHILAQWLIQFGFTVKVIDYCNEMSTSDLVAITQKHVNHQTVAIGVSTTFWKDNGDSASREQHFPTWVTTARELIESSFPSLEWILGGANATQLEGSYRNVSNLIRPSLKWVRFIDYAEDAVRKYLDEKLALGRIYQPYDIKITTNTYMDSLGILPSESIGIEWGRGCQFKCSFCGYKNIGKKKNSYLRDSKLVRQDIMLNYERYGTTRYIYVDDTVNESNEKIADMVEVAQSLPFRLEWVGYGRLDLLGTNKHTINALEDSGLRGMFFGVESFNKEASKIIGKGWNGVHGKDFMLELRDKWGDEVSFHANFIAGLRPETPEEVEQTVQWCINNKIHSFRFSPLDLNSTRHTSEFDKNYEKYGYRFPDQVYNWESDCWNFRSAMQTTNEIAKRIRPYNKPSSFALAALSSITDETMKVAMSKQPDHQSVRKKADEMISAYVTYQLNLKI